jgi:hypothetical protein
MREHQLPSRVLNLDGSLNPVLLDGAGKPYKSFDESVVTDIELMRVKLHRIDRGALDHDEARPTLGTACIVVNGSLRDRAVFVGEVGLERGHYETVLQMKIGYEGLVKKHFGGSFPSIPMKQSFP